MLKKSLLLSAVTFAGINASSTIAVGQMADIAVSFKAVQAHVTDTQDALEKSELELKQAKRQGAILAAQSTTLQEELTKSTQERDAALNIISTKETEIMHLQEDLARLVNDHKALQATHGTLTTQFKKASTDLNTAKGEVSKLEIAVKSAKDSDSSASIGLQKQLDVARAEVASKTKTTSALDEAKRKLEQNNTILQNTFTD